MDFELDYNDERERDSMEITMDDLTIEIPEELIEERIKLTGYTREKTQDLLEKKATVFKKCLISNNEYDKNTFEKIFINHLNSEMAVYRLP